MIELRLSSAEASEEGPQLVPDTITFDLLMGPPSRLSIDGPASISRQTCTVLERLTVRVTDEEGTVCDTCNETVGNIQLSDALCLNTLAVTNYIYTRHASCEAVDTCCMTGWGTYIGL